MRESLRALLCLAFLCCCQAALGAARADVPLPLLQARITDLTATLSGDQQAKLEQRLAAFESAKGAQLVVLLLPSTQPETIEQYGIRLAEAWKIGRRGSHDGVILIVAKNDRTVRIEVGYGLEGAIPDAVAKRIIEERIVPRFRAGDFFDGVWDGVQALIRVVEGETLPPPRTGATADRRDSGEDWETIGLFALAAAARALRSAFGLLGALLAAGLAGGLAWHFLGSGLAAAVAALLIFLFAFAKGGGGGWSSGGGGWSSGRGGGYSGGGGGFGGGGASGRW